MTRPSRTPAQDDLCSLRAIQVVDLLKRKDISPLDLVEASIKRIEAVDTGINALPMRRFEQAREEAKRISYDLEIQNPRSLHGLPIAVKDYNDVAGTPTTYGSPIFRDHIPKRSDATVQKLQNNGAIVMAKSNVPEWAGGNTFNPVYGATRNPWNLNLSVGGSSGGSSAALASGQVWLATGNDLGGSLRTPASFNGIVGLRPTPGLVPRAKRLHASDLLWVEGPMGRCVEDVALMLCAGAGHMPDDPLSFEGDGVLLSELLLKTTLPQRVAFSKDLGEVAIEPEIARICESSLQKLSAMGTEITGDIPDFRGVMEGFQTLRALLLAVMMQPIIEEHRDLIAPEIIDNIERGFKLDVHDIIKAEQIRAGIFHAMMTFFETHDFLICPAASVAPFPVEDRYVKEINGQTCKTYIDWFSITFLITMTACPTVCIPCGFTQSGLPVGIQIVGKPRGEAQLLSFARQFEESLGIYTRLPVQPNKLET